ncbi:50S ribosomal protein L29 [bacterium]|jgi:large subunit ribosomal protein L29|nr:50S ribosomal protein L29 [bacterium]MCI0611352.1 50S ribosomal protein L29 [bacterium]
MKAKELKDLTVDELKVKERDLYDQLFKLRFQAATAQLEKPATIRIVRRDLARVKTIIKMKSEVQN